MAQSKIETVEDAIAHAKELIDIYEEVSQTEIPRSVQQARKEGWKLIPRGIVVAGLVHYEDDDRKTDGQRVIPLKVALQLIEDFEDGLITKTVKDPNQIFVGKVKSLIGIVRYSLNAIPLLWDLAKEAISLWDIVELLAWIARLGFLTDPRTWAFVETVFELARRWLGLIASAMVVAFGLPIFNATVLDVEKEREKWVGKMRKKALPQRGGPRVWRRKVSRL